MTRNKMRENIMKLLYQADVHQEYLMTFFIEAYNKMSDTTLTNDAYFKDVLENFIDYKTIIDKDISDHLKKWHIDRLGKVELAILRLAITEMYYIEDIPHKVSINEAVELAKTFADDSAPKYINGVLASILEKIEKISLGIDTSCYTTSLVAIDRDNHILFEDRMPLEVKEGHLGLRQSEAFFQHIRNLPNLYEKCLKVIDPTNIGSVCVSSQPRHVKGSYMPVFTAGTNIGKVIAESLKCPYLEISHQENHLYAVAFEHPLPQAFIGVHISGGTSEILKVQKGDRMTMDIIGQSLDLSFGQLIDRLGLYMGLAFPCGKRLDAYRTEAKDRYQLKLSIKDLSFNLSGFENKLKAFYDQDKNIAKVSNTLFYYLGEILSKVLADAMAAYDLDTVVLSGGVCANGYLREVLSKSLSGKVLFPKKAFATDHALGNAYYGSQVYHDET